MLPPRSSGGIIQYKQNLGQNCYFSLRVKKGWNEEMYLINFLSTQQHIRAPDAPASLFWKETYLLFRLF